MSFCLSKVILLESFFFLVLLGEERTSVSMHMRNGWLFPFVVESNVATDCKIANYKCHEGILE